MNASRTAVRLVLPALVTAAVFGGTVAPASAEPTIPQSHQEVSGDDPGGDLGGPLGGLLNSVLGPDGLLGGLLGGLGG